MDLEERCRKATASLALLSLIAALAGCGGDEQAPTVSLQSPRDVAASTLAPVASATPASEPTPSPSPSATSLPATSTSTPSPTPTPQPTATPTTPPTSTETPVPPTPTAAEGSVAIINLIYDPIEGRDAEGEAVILQNLSDSPVDMTGWTLTDIAGHLFTFPPFVLQPGATVTVHICSGTDTAEILFWGHCSAVWNNDGDTAYLHDATGRIITEYSY